MSPTQISDWFSRAAHRSAHYLGAWYSFFAAVLIIIIWSITGPLFKFSDTWQMVINTGTTIITFLMVFLLQNTQNHDSKAIHVKLDEIIHALKRADNKVMGAEQLTADQLADLDQRYEKRSPP